MKFLPWQSELVALLQASRERNALPHALVLTGACDLEKKQFAEAFSAILLCHSPKKDQACGVCHGCRLMLAKSHPDFLLIEPEQSIIKVDQIREMVSQSQETAMQGGMKVIVIYPAHAMNMSAANALLKTLEEPAPNTILILISNQSARMPATIMSRCQKIIFKVPPHAVAVTWLRESLSEGAPIDLLLKLADGAPMKAVSLVEQLPIRQTIYDGLVALGQGEADPLEMASQWQEYDMLIAMRFILSWLRDFLCCQLVEGESQLINHDYHDAFLKFKKVSNDKILAYYDLVKQKYTSMLHLQNLNKQLLLEELLIQWTKLYVPC